MTTRQPARGRSGGGTFEALTEDQQREMAQPEAEAVAQCIERERLPYKTACELLGISWRRSRERRALWPWYDAIIAQGIARHARDRVARADELVEAGASPQHQQWMLEKIDPGTYGRGVQQVEISGPEGGAMRVESRVAVPTGDLVAEIEEALRVAREQQQEGE